MKKFRLSDLENKYYYSISRYFWHIVIAIGILAIAGGIITYFWTFVPPSKEKVVKATPPAKPKYPDVETVNIQDVLMRLPQKPPKKTKKTNNVTQYTPEPETYTPPQQTQVVKIDSVALQNFNKELEKTKSFILLATNPKFWEDVYKYSFDTPRDKKMYKKNHNPKLRKQKLVKPGFRQRFIRFTDNNGLKKYSDKTNLLAAYNTLLKQFAVDNRISFINNIALKLSLKKIGINTINLRYNAMGSAINNVAPDKQFPLYNTLWRFIRSNPNDGIALTKYIGDHLSKIAYESKYKFVNNVLNEYNRHYNNDLAQLEEATNQFLSFIDRIPGVQQANALKIHYEIFTRNNLDRTRSINQINNDYNKLLARLDKEYINKKMQAESVFNHKKSEKRNLRMWSYKTIGAAFAVVLIISLFLLILSMIRNINRLTEAMYQNNKTFQEHIMATKQEKEEVSGE